MTQPEVRFAPQALSDIEAIANYISYDSPYNAMMVVDDLYLRAQRILNQPDAGRMVPEFKEAQIREVFEHSWRIIYTTEYRPDIIILRFIHFGQNLRRL